MLVRRAWGLGPIGKKKQSGDPQTWDQILRKINKKAVYFGTALCYSIFIGRDCATNKFGIKSCQTLNCIILTKPSSRP